MAASALRNRRARRRLRFETLERRQLLAYDLAYSVFPDDSGPQNAEFGTVVAASDSYLVVASPREMYSETSSNRGAIRVYDATTRALLTTVNNPAPVTNDQFGFSVAVSGNLVVVGKSSSQNKAFVFNATTGALVATLTGPGSTSEGFGRSVAIDGTTVVVGAPFYSTSSIGRVYVYNALTGALLRTLPYPVATTRPANFGAAVAISGNTIIAGAPNEFTIGSGAAYVFDASTGAYLRPLVNPTPANGDQFGSAAAISGTTAVIAAVGDNGAGAAYVFAADTGGLLSTLKASSPEPLDKFGSSVAIRGAKAVVGAIEYDNPLPYAAKFAPGSAYLFDAPSGALLTTLDNPEPAVGDSFGSGVAITADFALIGARFDNTGRHESGREWLYNLNSAAWEPPLVNPSKPAEDGFGSVALDGDLLAVSAYQDDTDAQNMGQVYVFNAFTGALVSTFHKADPGDDDWFGRRVDISGDYVVAGAQLDDTQNLGNGRAYVFNARTGALVTRLNNPGNDDGDWFGSGVGISGNLAVVGARYGDIGASRSGVAYVFNATTGALVSTLNNPTPAAEEQFGINTAIDGNLVAVQLGSKSQNGAGEVYLFNALTGALLATLVDPSQTDSGFGSSIAVQGGLIAVGDSNSAAVHIFDASGTRLRTVLGLAGEIFGASVALAGDRLVVGASAKSNTGQVFVYNVQTGSLLQTIDNPTPNAGDAFGVYVDASLSAIVVGALGDDTQNINQGAAYGFIDSTSLRVNSVSATPTGARFTLNRPAALGDLNLTGNAVDVSLIGAAGGAVSGSLIIAPGDTDFTFVASGGVLRPDNYTLTLRGATDGFHTPTGELLNSNGGIPGGNHVATFQVGIPAVNAITVSLPHFARGPEQAVNVPASSSLGLPIQVSDGGNLTAMNFDLAFDPGLLDITAVTLVGGGTATLTPAAGRVQVALTFASPLASGPQTVAYLTAVVPTSAASRYGEREVLDISALSLTAAGSVPGIDQDAVHVNAYFGDVGRNGRYDSFDVQQASRMALRLDTGFQQHPLLDPNIVADFNSNGRIDSFDVQRLSRLALRLPVTEVAALPSPSPTTTDTDRLTEEPPKAEPVKTVAAPRSDVDGNGAVDAQDVAWAIYYFNRSSNGVVPDAPQIKLDLNGDQQFDPADVLLAITDFNAGRATHEGESSLTPAADMDSTDELETLSALLATDVVAARKRK